MLPLPDVPIFNGLDWFWGSSALCAWRFWRHIRPSVVILQWWTATVLHSYVTLAWLAKRAGARLVIEFHEVQDVGEARLPLVRRYTRGGDAALTEPGGRRRRALRVRSKRAPAHLPPTR